MKRSNELRPLSVEHHHALVQCVNLRKASAGELPIDATIREFLARWDDTIRNHFVAEEEILLPALAAWVPPDHALLLKTMVDHVAIRRDVEALRRADDQEKVQLVQALSQTLEEHIRFEEQQLFAALEETLTRDQLRSVGERLAKSCRDYG